MMLSRRRVLVVDPAEPQQLRVLRPTLATGQSAIATSTASQSDLILLDFGLPAQIGR